LDEHLQRRPLSGCSGTPKPETSARRAPGNAEIVGIKPLPWLLCERMTIEPLTSMRLPEVAVATDNSIAK